jgi:membrane-bound metal-dependent hydrolase YbcI (DUF457 family)
VGGRAISMLFVLPAQLAVVVAVSTVCGIVHSNYACSPERHRGHVQQSFCVLWLVWPAGSAGRTIEWAVPKEGE